MLLPIAVPLIVILLGALLATRVRRRNRRIVLAMSIIAAVTVFAAMVARNPAML